MRLFHKTLRFEPIDPLGDGLREIINRERTEDERIELTEYIDASELLRKWEEIQQEFSLDTL